MKNKIPYSQAITIANKYKNLLAPYCHRIEIAGSIRRQCKAIGDLELVCIPDKLYFDKFCREVNKIGRIIKGKPTGRYVQIELEVKIKLDLFIANLENWGSILAIRTGSSNFSHKILACGWTRCGYKSKDGVLYDKNGKATFIREEKDLFDLIGIPFVEPKLRF